VTHSVQILQLYSKNWKMKKHKVWWDCLHHLFETNFYQLYFLRFWWICVSQARLSCCCKEAGASSSLEILQWRTIKESESKSIRYPFTKRSVLHGSGSWCQERKYSDQRIENVTGGTFNRRSWSFCLDDIITNLLLVLIFASLICQWNPISM